MSNVEVERVKFHENAITISVGKEWDIGYQASTINIIVTGTATTFEAKFEGKLNGVWSTIMGVRLDTLVLANSATVKNIMYQSDLTGMDAIRFNLTSISGGDITVYGFAVR